MPELAEVEYARKSWDAALGAKITALELHAEKRVFRETDSEALVRRISGSRFIESIARGKQMLFRFSGQNSLGIHLGMSGSLRVEAADFVAEKHDHLVLRQAKRALVFRDPRQFGRVRFHQGKSLPAWWSAAPEIGSREFTAEYFNDFLARHHRAPIKAVLLLQSGFPGIGNWMADEILWRANVAPAKRVAALSPRERSALLRATRFVARESLRVIGHDNSDLPRTWLIHERWSATGVCPRDKTPLRRATIGGRTTAWCPHCQAARKTRRA